MMRLHWPLQQALFLFLATAVLFLLFATGIHGQFLLDDVGNLRKLADVANGTWNDFILFLSSGVGPGGRPLSLLTFAVQAEAWPNPAPFRVVNISIHCANFLLVFCLVSQVLACGLAGSLHGMTRKERFFTALVLAMLWAVAPIQVNSVEYVIQRMTLLSTFFILVGLNIWMAVAGKGQAEVKVGWGRRKRILILTVSYLACLAAAVLSKESGALLPLFLLALVFAFGFSDGICKKERVYLCMVLVAPVSAYIVYFIIYGDYYFSGAYETRSFTLGQRLITQPAIVVDYMRKVIFPWGANFTLFNDNFDLIGSSRSYKFIVPFLLIVFVIAFGSFSVKRAPIFGFGILFFFLGHVLESTALPLELYFEHRNYLPSLGLWIALFGAVQWISSKFVSRKLRLFLLACPLLFYSLVTYAEAKLWENPVLQAARWYDLNPRSNRAHSHLALTLSKYGLVDESSEFFKNTRAFFPHDISKSLLWLELECLKDVNEKVPEAYLYSAAKKSIYYNETMAAISSIVTKYESGQCSGRVPGLLINTLLVLLSNDSYDHKVVDINVAIAKLFFVMGKLDEAKEFLGRALSVQERLDVQLAKVQVDLALGEIEQARALFSNLRLSCSEKTMNCLKFESEMRQIERSLGNPESESLND